MIDMKILRRAHHQHRPALPLQPSNPPAALLLLPPPPLLLLGALWLPLPFGAAAAEGWRVGRTFAWVLQTVFRTYTHTARVLDALVLRLFERFFPQLPQLTRSHCREHTRVHCAASPSQLRRQGGGCVACHLASRSPAHGAPAFSLTALQLMARAFPARTQN